MLSVFYLLSVSFVHVDEPPTILDKIAEIVLGPCQVRQSRKLPKHINSINRTKNGWERKFLNKLDVLENKINSCREPTYIVSTSTTLGLIQRFRCELKTEANSRYQAAAEHFFSIADSAFEKISGADLIVLVDLINAVDESLKLKTESTDEIKNWLSLQKRDAVNCAAGSNVDLSCDQYQEKNREDIIKAYKKKPELRKLIINCIREYNTLPEDRDAGKLEKYHNQAKKIIKESMGSLPLLSHFAKAISADLAIVDDRQKNVKGFPAHASWYYISRYYYFNKNNGSYEIGILTDFLAQYASINFDSLWIDEKYNNSKIYSNTIYSCCENHRQLVNRDGFCEDYAKQDKYVKTLDCSPCVFKGCTTNPDAHNYVDTKVYGKVGQIESVTCVIYGCTEKCYKDSHHGDSTYTHVQDSCSKLELICACLDTMFANCDTTGRDYLIPDNSLCKGYLAVCPDSCFVEYKYLIERSDSTLIDEYEVAKRWGEDTLCRKYICACKDSCYLGYSTDPSKKHSQEACDSLEYICACKDTCYKGYNNDPKLINSQLACDSLVMLDTTAYICACTDTCYIGYDKDSTKKNSPDLCESLELRSICRGGCTDSCATNYDPEVGRNDGSCNIICDCRDTQASNYNPQATSHNQAMCRYSEYVESFEDFNKDWENFANNYSDDNEVRKILRAAETAPIGNGGIQIGLDIGVDKIKKIKGEVEEFGLGVYNYPSLRDAITAILNFLDSRARDRFQTSEINAIIIGEADGHRIREGGIAFEGEIFGDISNYNYTKLLPSLRPSRPEDLISISSHMNNFDKMNLAKGRRFFDNTTLAFLRAYAVEQYFSNYPITFNDLKIGAIANTAKSGAYRKISFVLRLEKYFETATIRRNQPIDTTYTQNCTCNN